MKTTKRALWMSVISLILCFSMLVSTTFAWFTDEVTSGTNKIQAGTLRVDLELLDKETGKWNSLKKDKAPIFDYDKWEPGYVDAKILKVENEGTLALKWAAKFYSQKQLSILADVIDVYVLPSKTELAYPADRSLEGYTCVGTLRTFINTIEETTHGTLEAGESAYLGIALKMREEAGNEYQGLSLGGAFDIRIMATQLASEFDSFDNQYDKDATFDDFGDTSLLVKETKTLVAGADSVQFDLSNEGLNLAKVTVPAAAIADPAKPVTVTFDGIEPSITGENIQAYAYDIKVTNLKANLTEDQMVTVVVEAPNALAAMQAYHNGVLIEDAVYDEVAGTITFKTASFSPYDFTSQVEEVDNLEELRAALQKDGTTAKLMANITVDLTKETGAARAPEHAYKSNGTPKYYNGVMINGKNVGLDLNGYNITAFCGEAYNSNSDVGALFFVGENGSLNITNTGSVETGFIKMASSIYAVWAPYDSPSYVDIYGGAFIADSYAGDDIGTALDSNGNPDPVNGTMKNENTNRALIYAGFGGNMRVLGGYFLYNNTPNDTLDRNNGAFNAKDFYEAGPLLTIHAGVYLINKEYRQNPANTSRPDGSYDNYSVVLAEHCEVVENVAHSVKIDGNTYATWCCVTRKEVVDLSIDATTLYAVGQELNINKVTAKYNFGDDKVLSAGEYTVSAVDMSFGGKKVVSVSYTEFDQTFTKTFVITVSEEFNSIIASPDKAIYTIGETPEFIVNAIANDGTKGDVAGFTVTGVDTSSVGIKTVTVSFGGKTTTCKINVVNTDFIDTHKLWNFNTNGFWLGSSQQYYLYNDYLTSAFPGGANGENAVGFNNTPAGGAENPNSPSGIEYYLGANQYDLKITGALPYTTIGIGCITVYDEIPVGFGYYIGDDLTTLQYSAPTVFADEVAAGNTAYQDLVNAYSNLGVSANTKLTLNNFEPGRTYDVHWVVVFDDGLQPLADWTVKMKSSVSDDYFENTDKPDVNVIVLSGQSNASGATPITQEMIDRFGAINYSNVYMQYKNVYVNDAVNIYTQNQNYGFEKYYFGMGGYQDTTFGPDAALAYYLATTDGLKDQQWFIIKYAAPGTNLDIHWQQNNNLTDAMIAYVDDCIADLSEDYDVQLRSFLWMQGENDALDAGCADRYAANEQNLVSKFRAAFAKYDATKPNYMIPGSGIAFISAGIAPAGKDGNTWTYAATVNAAKVYNAYVWYAPGVTIPANSPLYGIADPGMTFNPNAAGIYNSAYIDTSLMSAQATDPAHYDAQSMDWLGTWFGEYVGTMMNIQLPTPPPPAADTYTVFLNANGGVISSDMLEVAVGGTITLPTPTRVGYYFAGWYDANGNKVDASYTPSANVMLNAKWGNRLITIQNNISGVTISGVENGQIVNAGDIITVTVTNNNARPVTFDIYDSTNNVLLYRELVVSGATSVTVPYAMGTNVSVVISNAYVVTVDNRVNGVTVTGVQNNQGVNAGDVISAVITNNSGKTVTISVYNETTGALIWQPTLANGQSLTVPYAMDCDLSITIK